MKKRERAMILDGSPCDTNFHADGPRTVAEAKRLGKVMCPHFSTCNSGGLNTMTGFGCLLMYGRDVAGFAVKEGHSVQHEINGEFRAFFVGECNPPKGFVWSPDRKKFVFITDKKDALRKVKEFATQIVE